MSRTAVALGITLVVGAGGAAAPGARAGNVVLVPEPALATGPGEALLAIGARDEAGRPVAPPAAASLTVEVDGRPLRDVTPVAWGAEAGEARAVLHVVVDPGAFSGLDGASWAGAIAAWAAGSSRPGERVVWVLGKRGPERVGRADRPPDVADLVGPLERGTASALWDGLLIVLDGLSNPEPGGEPERRSVLLVASGNEGRESLHPAATCADAADTARVAVHVLVPGGQAAGGGVARLRTLASRTGGGFRAGDDARGPDAFARAAATVGAAAGLRLRGLPEAEAGAFRVTVRAGVADPLGVAVEVRPRRALGLVPPPGPSWIPLLAGLAVAAGLGALLAIRFRPVGRLVVTGGAGAGEAPVGRRGVRIGAARGNDLVLDHPKVSRRHAVVKVENGVAVLVDLRSANGTRVNGRPVETARLTPGDRILLAEEVELVYQSRRRAHRR